MSGIEAGRRLPTTPRFPDRGGGHVALAGRRLLGGLRERHLPARRPGRGLRRSEPDGCVAGSASRHVPRRSADAEHVHLQPRAAGRGARPRYLLVVVIDPIVPIVITRSAFPSGSPPAPSARLDGAARYRQGRRRFVRRVPVEGRRRFCATRRPGAGSTGATPRPTPGRGRCSRFRPGAPDSLRIAARIGRRCAGSQWPVEELRPPACSGAGGLTQDGSVANVLAERAERAVQTVGAVGVEDLAAAHCRQAPYDPLDLTHLRAVAQCKCVERPRPRSRPGARPTPDSRSSRASCASCSR